MIHKLTPSEGPTTGGTEVSIYGRNFTSGCLVYFGEQLATGLTFYGDQSLLCVTPPGRVGAVHVTIVQAGNTQHIPLSPPRLAVLTLLVPNKVFKAAVVHRSACRCGRVDVREVSAVVARELRVW